MVFLRPVVMRDQASSNKLSLDRYDYIRAEQQNSQPPPNSVLQINESPVLPPIRPEAISPVGVPRPLGDVKPPPPVAVPSVATPAPDAAPVPAPAPARTN
jgi:general secretion pathway protein D